MLLLPHHHEFAETLANLPFFHKQMASSAIETLHILQKTPTSVPELATANTLKEYLLGGEADEFIEFVDGYADDGCADDGCADDGCDFLLNPWELGDEWVGSI